jgi:hypothetical protein
VAGRWIDPLTLRNVPAEPIPSAELADFLAWRDACRTGLELGVAPPVPAAGAVRLAELGGAGEARRPRSDSASAGR